MKENAKEPVRIRYKNLSNGNKSIYLDIYVDGVRSYEFLKMYIIPEKSRVDKDRNAETRRLAESVKAMRVLDIQSGRFQLKTKNKERISLLEWLDTHLDESKFAYKTKDLWSTARMHLKECFGDKKTLDSVRSADMLAFRRYLDQKTDLSSNSKVSYEVKFRALIHAAHIKGLIPENPFISVPRAKMTQTKREYLTVSELRLLFDTPYKKSVVKSAFLFACLTGLRWSDVKKLTWGEVKSDGARTRIVFSQHKTGSLEYLDINSQAADQMGERGEDDALVFARLSNSLKLVNMDLRKWAEGAGIKKYLTFHVARHTFAVMMIELGVDIYTVQKLLGHSCITTTQIYAKMMDKRKQDAVDLIPNMLDAKAPKN